MKWYDGYLPKELSADAILALREELMESTGRIAEQYKKMDKDRDDAIEKIRSMLKEES